jgi:hypothetical protein
MSDILQEVDGRSKLAGTNKFELLIFRLERGSKFPCPGILRHQRIEALACTRDGKGHPVNGSILPNNASVLNGAPHPLDI